MTEDARSSRAADRDLAAPPESPAATGYAVPTQTPPVDLRAELAAGPAGAEGPEAEPGPAAAAPPVTDRGWVQFAWEGALLVLLAGGIGLWWLLGRDTGLLRDPALLGDRMFAVAPFLLLATALAVSIRVRAVNLAAGAVAGLAALLFVKWEDDGQLIAAGLVVAAALAVTVALLGLVSGLRIPGWAASLGAAVAVLATTATVAEDAGIEVGASVGEVLTGLPGSATVTVADELVWLVVGAVMALSVLGGAIGLLPPVRRRLQACREAAAAPAGRDLSQALTTGAALLVSNLLAAGAGVLLVIPSGRVAGGALLPAGTLAALGIGLALAIVLLGGTSMWGRRGGVFGTLIAALAVFAAFAAFADLGWTAQGSWIVVGALGLGFLVSWLVELLGTRAVRPAPPPPVPAEEPAELAEPGSPEFASPEPAAVSPAR